MNKAELLKTVSINLRSVTQSCKGGVQLKNLQSDYKCLIGKEIPFKELGHNSLEAFLRNLPNVIHLKKDKGGLIAEAVADGSTAHIASLIANQKSSKSTKIKSSKKPTYVTRKYPSRELRSTKLMPSVQLNTSLQGTSNVWRRTATPQFQQTKSTLQATKQITKDVQKSSAKQPTFSEWSSQRLQLNGAPTTQQPQIFMSNPVNIQKNVACQNANKVPAKAPDLTKNKKTARRKARKRYKERKRTKLLESLSEGPDQAVRNVKKNADLGPQPTVTLKSNTTQQNFKNIDVQEKNNLSCRPKETRNIKTEGEFIMTEMLNSFNKPPNQTVPTLNFKNIDVQEKNRTSHLSCRPKETRSIKTEGEFIMAEMLNSLNKPPNQTVPTLNLKKAPSTGSKSSGCEKRLTLNCFPKIKENIAGANLNSLLSLNFIIFGDSLMDILKRSILSFDGVSFPVGSEEWKQKEIILSMLSEDVLKQCLHMFCLECEDGSKHALLDKLLKFLALPSDALSNSNVSTKS